MNYGLFNHHHPYGIIPDVQYLRLFFERADEQTHLFVLLFLVGACSLQLRQCRYRCVIPLRQGFVLFEIIFLRLRGGSILADCGFDQFGDNLGFLILLLDLFIKVSKIRQNSALFLTVFDDLFSILHQLIIRLDEQFLHSIRNDFITVEL